MSDMQKKNQSSQVEDTSNLTAFQNKHSDFTPNRINYQSAQFFKSAQELRDCPADSYKEVAFAGRSNAGKSSALNALTRSSKLSKTSKTPGRTQLINFFSVAEHRFLVDLPGYGYAKVSQTMKLNWQKNLDNYLANRAQLVGLVLLVDSRHDLKPFDLMMMQWSFQINMPLHILLTKADKLNSSTKKQQLSKLQASIANYSNITVQLFSATKKIGIETLANHLDQWLL